MPHRIYLEFAKQLAKNTGDMVKEKINSNFEIKVKDSDIDFVTEVDQTAERMIRSNIIDEFPQHNILGEEGASNNTNQLEEMLNAIEKEEPVWIIDPIDGTLNFIHSLPGYTVSIALVYNKQIALGVVYDPTSNDLFYASKGNGAFVNGKRMNVSTSETLNKSLIATGLPNKSIIERKIAIKNIANLGDKCLEIRAFGSAALHLAYVAHGRLDGYWESDLSIWDIAAGILLVQESGGKVTDTRGNNYDFTKSQILATNGFIHQDLLNNLVT